MQITFKDKAQANAKAQHTWEYVSILERLATPSLGVRCVFEMACTHMRYTFRSVKQTLFGVAESVVTQTSFKKFVDDTMIF